MGKIGKYMNMRMIAARKVSKITGKSVFYHFWDCIYCNIAYGCRCYQYSDMGFYQFPSYERARIMTSGHLQKASRLNDAGKLHFFDQKSEFDKAFDKFVCRAWFNCYTANADQIAAFLSQYNVVIVKPNKGEAGISVRKIDASRVDIVACAQSLAGKNVVMEECVVQHPALSFGSKSVNTIRIATMVDRDGNGHILKASFRCGIGNSVVDNWSAGGVAYPVNLDYGCIESYGFQTNSMAVQVYVHPGTETFMIGQKIPFWEDVKSMVLEACRVFPSVRYVGWDVAITSNGPLIIEGNPGPGFATLEGIGLTRGVYGMICDLK